jgi:hypothetical protein
MDDRSLFVSRSVILLISDLMEPPAASFQLLSVPILLFVNWEIVANQHDNPFRKILWVSNRLPDSPEGHALYAKSNWVSNHAVGALSDANVII